MYQSLSGHSSNSPRTLYPDQFFAVFAEILSLQPETLNPLHQFHKNLICQEKPAQSEAEMCVCLL